MCSGSARSLPKGEFLKIYLVIFCAAASKRRAITPSIRQYLICDVAGELILFWPDFGQGGGAIVTMLSVS